MTVVQEEYYRCNTCHAVVAVVKGSDDGMLKCCNKNMEMIAPDEAKRVRDSMPKPGGP